MDEMTSLEVRTLEAAIERGKRVRIYVINGYQINGVIIDFDCNVLLIEADGRNQMVYRHAISTIDLDVQ